MKKNLCAALLISVPFALSANETTDSKVDDALIKEARKMTKSFGMALKGTLQASMKADGPIAAIDVCNVQAPGIAAQQSTDGWNVARTALKVRNPDNIADDWEVEVMKDFAQRLEGGEKPKALEASKIENGEFRYVRAIPTGKVCLACHGASISAPVANKIASLYPQDQATGFKEGELRGVFTLSKKLAE